MYRATVYAGTTWKTRERAGGRWEEIEEGGKKEGRGRHDGRVKEGKEERKKGKVNINKIKSSHQKKRKK